MKTILINKKILSLALASILLFTSCLKDKDVDDNKTVPAPSETPTLIEIPGTVSEEDLHKAGVNTNYNVNLVFSTADTIIDLCYVRLANGNVAKEDIVVPLNNNPALVTTFNTFYSSLYTVPAATLYSFPNGLSVTIKAGKQEGALKLKLKPSDFATTPYAFGINIASVPAAYQLSGNYKNAVITLGVKNEWDGSYRVANGLGSHPNPALTGPFSTTCGTTFDLVTSGTNSVDLSPGQPTNNGGGISYFGAVVPRFIIGTSATATKPVSVVGGAPGNGVIYDNYNADCSYNSNTKTFTLKVGWSGTRVYTYQLVFCRDR
jgi:hypothetical protein